MMLPKNVTYLMQPLDVCVFAPFKRAIRDGIFDYMIEDDEVYTIPRAAALEIASSAWRWHVSPANMVSGFAEAERYTSGRVPVSFDLPEWLAAQSHVRRTLLHLPDESKKPPKRRKLRVGGRILSLQLLRQISSTKRATKRKHKRGCEVDYSPGSERENTETNIREIAIV
ncbi:hypothetical protein Ae201684_013873 [Aphanomyces euteiches]|uniref:DDE-1 domain-containing protein n=1 Tax=Aphanomyces euteiches TaxID=100861 RepID=A0A6G0WLV8_9STRA|nr:hypothetical protein Ae201684_013873 [Aphanomyces euteiches]KAH9153721.1 hypothetical protein AeRB84_004082 [Aphanomyces euteiches]